jgi:integrase
MPNVAKQSKEFEESIVNLLKEKKNLSDSSITVYLRNLKKLNDDIPYKDFKFLIDSKKIEEKLKDYKENTKRNYLISIVSVLSLYPQKKQIKKLHDIYYDLMMKKNDQIKKEVAPEDLTAKQEENWMSWDQVKQVYKSLEETVDKFVNSEVINEVQYNQLLSYMILSLYVLLEPRRNKDYQLMVIVKQYKKSPETSLLNYLDLTNKKFIFNNYKTSKKYGPKEIAIPDDLYKVIEKYLKHHILLRHSKTKLTATNQFPFLVNYGGSPLDKVNSITRILNKTFGKAIGSSMLRHIFLTGKFGPVLEEQKKIAGNMAHSVEQQKDYIKIPKKIVVSFLEP